MANIEAKLTVEIEVKNYEQVVKNDKGRSWESWPESPRLTSSSRIRRTKL
jgi:hypothetical protein